MGKNKHKDRGSASFPNGSNSHISFVMAPLQVPNGSSLGGAIRNHSQKSTIPDDCNKEAKKNDKKCEIWKRL